jgi:hypothetical protein
MQQTKQYIKRQDYILKAVVLKFLVKIALMPI